jgi:hypothetical protein
MKITVQVLIESADALPLTLPILTIDRLCERIEEVGLQTAEAKSILKGLEESVVRNQLGEFLAGKRSCRHCVRSAPRMKSVWAAINCHHSTSVSEAQIVIPNW